jgi:hypothetical protein
MVSFSIGTFYKFIFFIVTILLFLCIANNLLTYMDLIDYKSFFNTLELSLYSVIGFTTLIILFTCLYNIYSSTSKLYGLFNILPIAFFITSIIYNIYLIVNYKNEIVKEKIDLSYYGYSSMTLLLSSIIYFILYINIVYYNLLTTGLLSSIFSALSYLLSLFLIIILVYMFIILNYFRTDG